MSQLRLLMTSKLISMDHYGKIPIPLLGHVLMVENLKVEALLHEFVSLSGSPFYLQTSKGAETHLLRILQEKYGVENYPDTFDLANPGENVNRDQVLLELVKSDNIGCGYIKLLMSRPFECHVPKTLTRAFYRAYFRVIPNTKYSSVFVLHNTDINYGIRGRLWEYFSNKVGLDHQDLTDLNWLAARHLELTINLLAKDLPVYNIKLSTL
eukprot:gene14989-17725_t